MGLDWKPMNKPHDGHEEEYKEIFDLLTGETKQCISFIDRLKGKKKLSSEELLDKFLSISTTPYETLKAPQVGLNEEATKWAETKFENREDKSLSLEEFIKQMHGFYVLELVPKCDGLPYYIAMHDEAHVFRAQFFNDCKNVLGSELFEMAYESKLAKETLEYSNRLMQLAEQYANENNCLEVRDNPKPHETDENDPKHIAHVIFSAAKWLQFWSSRGHGMEADF